MNIHELGEASLKILNSHDFPKTRGELEQRLFDEIEQKIGITNSGNGFAADMLFRVLDFIEERK